MRAVVLALMVLIPTAAAAPLAFVGAAGEARSTACAEPYVIAVAYDPATGSGAMRGTAASTCASPYMAWPPGACDITPAGTVNCAQYFPITVAGQTTLYFHQWVNMALASDGAFRFTIEHETTHRLDSAVEGVLTRIDA